MYLITEKTSKQSEKITALFERMAEVNRIAQATVDKLLDSEKNISFRIGHFAVAGGVSSILIEDEDFDPGKVWKEVRKNEYYPKKNTKRGKAIAEELQSLPTIQPGEINRLIDINQVWGNVGIYVSNPTYFGIVIGESMLEEAEKEQNWKIPEGYKEVTRTEFNTLFPQ